VTALADIDHALQHWSKLAHSEAPQAQPSTEGLA
jgi:hypothetical protein